MPEDEDDDEEEDDNFFLFNFAFPPCYNDLESCFSARIFKTNQRDRRSRAEGSVGISCPP